MKIVILGAAGFIGTNLALELQKDANNQITLVDKSEQFFSKTIMNFENIRIIEASPTSDMDFEKILKNQDTVYHLISTTVPTTSNGKIAEEIRENVILSVNLLEACVRNSVHKVIFMSSGGTVYGKRIDCPLKEDTPTNPISSYGMQKVMIEKLLYLYYCMHGIDYRIIRLSNPYGPYQRPNGILGAVTTFTYRAIKGEKISVYGDGSVIRDFIYIDDAVKAIITIANNDTQHKVYNLGSGIGTSINTLLDTIENVVGRKINVIHMQGRAVDVPINYLDISRYENEFGEINHISLTEGIQKTADFLRKEYK